MSIMNRYAVHCDPNLMEAFRHHFSRPHVNVPHVTIPGRMHEACILSTGTLGRLYTTPEVAQFDIWCETGLWKKLFYYKEDDWNGCDLLQERRNKMNNGWYIGPCNIDTNFQLEGTYIGKVLTVEKEKKSYYDDRMRVWRSESPRYFFIYGCNNGKRRLKCWDYCAGVPNSTNFQLHNLCRFLKERDSTCVCFKNLDPNLVEAL